MSLLSITAHPNKPVTTVVFLTAIIFSLTPVLANAESAWWEKGLNILKSLDDNQGASEDSQGAIATGLTNSDISGAFKEALRIGSEKVVNQLGHVDGFNTDPAIHIPLPPEFSRVKQLLDKIGMSAMVDDLELKLNRAAEVATPKAKSLFMDAISNMTFEDVTTIYKGPTDSATQYFRNKMTPDLTDEMRPIITESLSQVGAIQAYDKVIDQYKTLPFVPDVKADLTNHVIEKGIDGIFLYLAKEETAIRSDPARHTTALLQKVFGANK